MDNKSDLCPKSCLQEEPMRSNHYIRQFAIAPNIAVNIGKLLNQVVFHMIIHANKERHI